MTEPPSDRYRPCAGAMIFDRRGRVWIGKRRMHPPASEGARVWQMPQGGIDPGEEPLQAARREAREETGMTSLELLGEAPDWYRYDLPPGLRGGGWTGRFDGQAQKWFAFQFTGDDREIDISAAAEDADAEFECWRWERLERLPELVVPFKRPIYAELVRVFAGFAAAPPGSG